MSFDFIVPYGACLDEATEENMDRINRIITPDDGKMIEHFENNYSRLKHFVYFIPAIIDDDVARLDTIEQNTFIVDCSSKRMIVGTIYTFINVYIGSYLFGHQLSNLARDGIIIKRNGAEYNPYNMFHSWTAKYLGRNSDNNLVFRFIEMIRFPTSMCIKEPTVSKLVMAGPAYLRTNGGKRRLKQTRKIRRRRKSIHPLKNKKSRKGY